MFLPACSIPSLVRRKWSKILYLGATFALTLVEDTPGLTEDVRTLIFPTKSSEEKVQCVFGSQLNVEKCDVSSQCGGVSLFQGPKQRERYFFKKLSPSFTALSHSPLVKKTSP